MVNRFDIATTMANYSPVIDAPSDITDSTPLFDGGLDLDSLAFLDCVLALEQQLSIKLDENTLSDASLDTFGAFSEKLLGMVGS